MLAEPPILRRFPALARLPRASFGTFPTPVENVSLTDGRPLFIKRDDRSGASIGGNKVRCAEWLLGAIRDGDHVVTVGPRGSTHALTTATYARQLGARVTVVRWNQEMNPAARAVDARLRSAARIIDARWAPSAYAIAAALRMQKRVRWIPAGGASPLAALGHVNAALELVEQSARGEAILPERVVVPLGTGGTAAGLALGFRIAGLPIRVVAVRVVPRIVGRRRRIISSANRAARLIELLTDQSLPRVAAEDIVVAEEFYGGAYGRPVQALADERALDALGIRLDDTYSRKAFAAAIAQANHRTLFWLTFDGRILGAGPSTITSATTPL
jgi:D-cysteine desulfhydrase